MKVGDLVRTQPMVAESDLYPAPPDNQAGVVIDLVQRDGVIIDIDPDYDDVPLFLVMWRDGTLDWIEGKELEVVRSL